MAKDVDRSVDATTVRLFVEMFYREGRQTCKYPEGEKVSAIVEYLTQSPSLRTRYSIDQVWKLIELGHNSGKIGSYLCEDGVEPMIASKPVVLSVEAAHDRPVLTSLKDGKPVDQIFGVIENIKGARREAAYNIVLGLLNDNFGRVHFTTIREELIARRLCVESELRGIMTSVGIKLSRNRVAYRVGEPNAAEYVAYSADENQIAEVIVGTDDNTPIWAVSYHLYLGEAASIKVRLQGGGHTIYPLSDASTMSPEPLDGFTLKVTISPVEAVELLDGNGNPLEIEVDLRGSRTIYIY